MWYRRQLIIVTVITLVMLLLPLWFASSAGGASHVFGGFLFNPLDGNSYLAKMRTGWEGGWKFELLYSPEAGEGAYLFLLYAGLGHLARLASIPLIWMFHFARVVASVFLVFTLWRFALWFAHGDERKAAQGFTLAVFGSGLGWFVSIAAGYLTGDFWIAETYPFLSMVANPHFPLGLGLILWIGLCIFEQRRSRFLILPVLSVLLGLVQPFGVVIAAVLLIAYTLANVRSFWLAWLLDDLLALAPGFAVVFYQYLVIREDPMLAAWNAQNVTVAPVVWDVMLSLSPAFLLALLGGFWGWRSGDRRMRMAILWAVFGLLLIYFPIDLQRRFMTGLYIPIALLAVEGVQGLSRKLRWGAWVWTSLLVTSVLTNGMLYLASVSAIVQKDPALYLTSGEAAAMQWIADNLDAGEVVLASPGTGAFIPAWTGKRVIYGHPFESIQADEARAGVEQFFNGSMPPAAQADFVRENHVQIIFIGQRERLLGPLILPSRYARVFEGGGVLLYTVQE